MAYTVFHAITEGIAMVGLNDGPLGQSKKVVPHAAGGSISGVRVLMGIILFFIGIAAVTGVAMAVSSGQPALAIAIGLIAGAFFCRVGC